MTSYWFSRSSSTFSWNMHSAHTAENLATNNAQCRNGRCSACAPAKKQSDRNDAGGPEGRRWKSADVTLLCLCEYERHRLKEIKSLQCWAHCPVCASGICTDGHFFLFLFVSFLFFPESRALRRSGVEKIVVIMYWCNQSSLLTWLIQIVLPHMSLAFIVPPKHMNTPISSNMFKRKNLVPTAKTL